jgi:hypothetical protein
MFDNNKLKDLETLMKNFSMGTQNTNIFNINKIKKYLIIGILSLFLFGISFGILIGLMF